MGRNSVLIDLPALTIRQVAVSEMDNDVYLITVKSSGAQVLIDAADEPSTILRLIDSAKADAAVPTHLDVIVTTHSHWDHIRALKEVAAATGALTVAGAEDVGQIEVTTGVKIDRAVEHGDTVEAPGLSLDVIGLRGHTPGSITLALAQPDQPVHLFTGDSLFPGGVGNTNRDPARFKSLLADVSQRLFEPYDDATWVHPGHGKPTTLGAERPHLSEWAARGW
ncbi:MAG: MBL fold metallo-hydrolase [Propionibacteriaceae bacterium]|jgi:glyoxylase-like metal-dependent hydrolase (beta-lactamase superfamily II)|nr:MBL fold metallo-hydrolase [Propionibacteriaceae bacterium]